jgi:hypothetical protein
MLGITMEEKMDFGTAILYVLAVLAITVVAGLIIYAISGLIISIVDKKNVKLFSSNDVKEQLVEQETLLLENSKDQKQEASEENKESAQTVDFDLADEEKKSIVAQRNELAERAKVVENATDEDEEEEEEPEEDLNELYQKMIAEINAEALTEEEPTEETAEEPEEEPVEETEEVEEPVDFETVAEEPAEEKVEEAEEPVEEAEEPVEETEEVEEPAEEPVDEEKENLKSLVEELKAQLAKEQKEKQVLADFVEAASKETLETESVDSLNERLSVLSERLAKAEKDLKANKKEYLPLCRIKKTLEADKAKLRRKEAIVAKQKVVLFGVNNYVVDPEKEQKLSEDLDVLDALRLSVQHCEEVMKDSADRYPILEKTNEILTKQVTDLRSDVEDIKQRIANASKADAGDADSSAE